MLFLSSNLKIQQRLIESEKPKSKDEELQSVVDHKKYKLTNSH